MIANQASYTSAKKHNGNNRQQQQTFRYDFYDNFDSKDSSSKGGSFSADSSIMSHAEQINVGKPNGMVPQQD